MSKMPQKATEARRFIVSHSIIDVAPILAGILPSKIGANKVARQTAGIPLGQQIFLEVLQLDIFSFHH